MSYGSGLAETLGCLCIVAVVGMCGFLGFGCYYIFSADEIESSTRIIPEIRLVTDGKKIDTLYIYKQK
jgi:hypothetical protein